MYTLLQVKRINAAKLNNDEYTQFMKEVVTNAVTATIEKLAITEDLLTEMRKKIDNLTEASHQSRVNQSSDSIEGLDKLRSNLLSYLVIEFKNSRKSGVHNEAVAAGALYKEFKNYTSTHNTPKRQKSQIIDSFLKDIDKPENLVNIDILRLAESVKKLKDTNKRYQEMVAGRSEEELNRPRINVRKERKELRDLYLYLIAHAEAKNIVEPSDEAAAFITKTNKLIDDTVRAHSQRVGIAAANKKKNNLDDEELPQPVAAFKVTNN